MTEHSPKNSSSKKGFLESPKFRELRARHAKIRARRNLRQSLFIDKNAAFRRRASSLSVYGDSDAPSRGHDEAGEDEAAELGTVNVEDKMPNWGKIPLWGEIVHKPKLKHITHNNHQAPRQRHDDGTVRRYSQGTDSSLGVLRIRLGLVHLVGTFVCLN